MSEQSFYQRVAQIQATLKAPKNQRNNFGNYNYRSCEDILEAVKPLLNGLVLTVNDDVQVIGDRVYIKSTATITDGKDSIANTAFAREPVQKKGMDESQITGAASSYARKYALNGLLLIDDNKDADTGVQHGPDQQQAQKQQQQPDPALIQRINSTNTLTELAAVWGEIPGPQKPLLSKCKDQRKAALGGK